MKATIKQVDMEDDDMLVVIFLVERNCEDNM
jgi:hypothetical protein